jgi:hypothetical protein
VSDDDTRDQPAATRPQGRPAPARCACRNLLLVTSEPCRSEAPVAGPNRLCTRVPAQIVGGSATRNAEDIQLKNGN